MTMWAVGLLHEFRIVCDDEVVVTLGSQHWERLLAYVAVHVERPVPRRELAAVLWPALAWDRARNRVSYELGKLRREMIQLGVPGNMLLVTRAAIRLDPQIPTDVKRFEYLVEAGIAEIDHRRRMDILGEARDVYGRGLLPLVDGPWLDAERRRLAALNVKAVNALLETARRNAGMHTLANSPLDEPAGLAEPNSRFVAEMVAFATEAADGIRSAQRSHWLGRVDEKDGALRLAHAKAIDSRDRQSAMWISGSLWEYWFERGHSQVGLHHIEAALAVGSPTRSRAEAMALKGAGALAISLGNLDAAESYTTTALSIFREAGDPEGEMRSESSLAVIALKRDRMGESRRRYANAIVTAREMTDTTALLRLLRGIAVVETDAGNHELAEAYLHERLALARTAGDRTAEAQCYAQMASIAEWRDDWSHAIGMAEQAGQIFGDIGDLLGMSLVARLLGYAEMRQQNFDLSRQHLDDALSFAHALGSGSEIGDSLYNIALLEAEQGHFEEAVRVVLNAIAILRNAGIGNRLEAAESDLQTWQEQLTGTV